MGVYASTRTSPSPAAPGKMGRVERAIAATRVRDNQRFLLFARRTVLIVAVVFGLVSRAHAAPAAGDDPHGAPPSRTRSIATIDAVIAGGRRRQSR